MSSIQIATTSLLLNRAMDNYSRNNSVNCSPIADKEKGILLIIMGVVMIFGFISMLFIVGKEDKFFFGFALLMLLFSVFALVSGLFFIFN